MDDVKSNNGRVPGQDAHLSDEHGYAALILVESLIHTLIANATITAEEAIEILDVASDVASQTAAGNSDGISAVGRQSLALLTSISASLSYELPKK